MVKLRGFFKRIERQMQKAAKEDYFRIKKMLNDEKPYTVAFVTDSDCCTLWLGVNTYEYMEKADAKYANDDSEYKTKWIPDEWGYTDDSDNSGLVKISDRLSDKMDSIYDEVDRKHADLTEEQEQELIDEYGFTRLFLETVTSAFQKLIQSNAFGLDTDEVTYFISMTDDELGFDIEDDSAKTLNSKRVYEEFLKRTRYNE